MEVDKKKENPLVSVIVPCYNHERYINQCIESIFNQTFKYFELIVIDDGSTDNSPKLLKELQQKYSFELRIQENHGIAYTLNRGIREFCKGEYITFCASDDYWSLDKLEKQVHFMESNRFYPMCYGKTHYVDEESTLLKKKDVNNRPLKGGWLFNDILLFKLHPPVNYMFRAEIYKEVGLYDEKIFAEDYFMNLLISSKYCIGYIDEYLSYYRYPGTSAKVIRYEIVANSHLQSIEHFNDTPQYEKAKIFVYLRNFDIYSGFTAHKTKAAINLFKSLRLIHKKRFWVAMIKLFIFWKLKP